MDLAARAAWALVAGGAPEVVRLAEAPDALGGYRRIVDPQVVGFVVLQVDAGPQASRLKPQLLGDELPGVLNGLLLEVVAHAEVAQHLKEGEMRGVTNQAHVRGAEALLRCGEAGVGRRHLAREVGLELHHARAGE